MIEQHNNSVIYRDVDEENILDFSHIGSNINSNEIVLKEPDHYFILGDAIFYDIKTNHYRRALANNTIMSEVIGVVSKIIDKDTFQLTLKGNIILDRYSNITTGSILYLSPIITGKLIPDEPDNVSKIIAIKTENGIKVDIQRGYHLKANKLKGEYLVTDDDKYIVTSDNNLISFKTYLSEYLVTDDSKNIITFDNKIIAARSEMEGYEEYTEYYSLRYYTQQELQDIIVRITNDIY